MDEFDISSDPAIPAYFLQEASELLQQMDDELQTLRQDFSVQKMHALMRIAHTLKGAAASVGLDSIKTTTHSLEDAFRALCMPEASLTVAVEGLIFDAYACLQLLLTARLANTQIEESGILDRMAGIVSQLQENLGDQFGQDGYLPTSAELGFDITQSIFEMGVTQRLTDLEDALKDPDPDVLTAMLQAQADVFFGLAESLNLPGFGGIAQATLNALNQNPHQVVKIAQVALADYRLGHASVLQGDRSQGGEPSPALQQFSASTHQLSPAGSPQSFASSLSWVGRLRRWFTRPIPGTPRLLPATHSPVSQLQPSTISANSIVPAASPSTLVLTPGMVAIATPDTHAPDTHAPDTNGPDTTIDSINLPPQLELTAVAPKPLPQLPPAELVNPNPSNSSNTLRVSVEHLDQLNYTVGELLTQQNQQALYNQRLTETLKTLFTRFDRQQRQLYELQQHVQLSETDLRPSHPPSTSSSAHPTTHQFDSLELEQYGSLHRLVQAPLDHITQQMENAEAIELFAHQSQQSLEKQQRLIGNLRDTLFDVRMQPLGHILNRFHPLLARLSEQENKPVTLQLKGEAVLIDKVIADKLYDALLHLVRNAFDHGIETPDVRQQQGKRVDGTIRLVAHQDGHYLMIKVRDNGRGLNLATIRKRAIETQLITPEESITLTPDQIRDLIFEPSFSTLDQPNSLSGRGIGLDVVRSQIRSLDGDVTVDHQPGRGTYFTLRIPTNLTIAKLLLFQAGKKLYALMTEAIRQVVIPKPGQVIIRGQEKTLSWHVNEVERLIPVISLSEFITYRAPLPSQLRNDVDLTLHAQALSPIILIRHNNRIIGLEVDQLQGEQELTIRPLGKMAATPAYIYGCSTLPDSRLSLVLDAPALVQTIVDNSPQLLTAAQNEQAFGNANEDTSMVSTQKTILIVDDSITARNTLATTLKKAGYSVVQAKEGIEALQMLKQIQADAILCDLEMPGMNGFDFLKARQQDAHIACIPILMLTSRTGTKHRDLAQTLGATDYLTKPYLAPHLLDRLLQALSQPSETRLLIAPGGEHGQ